MRYRHQQMTRLREQGRARRAALVREVELAFWTSLTDEERSRWRVFSGAVAAVPGALA